MDHHRPPPKRSGALRILALVVAIPVLAVLVGFLYGQSSSSPGAYGRDFDSAVFGTLAGLAGLVLAPIVALVLISRRRGARRGRRRR